MFIGSATSNDCSPRGLIFPAGAINIALLTERSFGGMVYALVLLAAAAALNHSSQRFDRQCRRVLLPRWQTTEHANDFLAGQLQSIFNSHSCQHLGQRRTARERGRTAISEKSRGLDAAIMNAQT